MNFNPANIIKNAEQVTYLAAKIFDMQKNVKKTWGGINIFVLLPVVVKG